MSEQTQKGFRTTFLVTVVIFISKACGFVREIVVSAKYGNTFMRDAYESAYTIFYLPVLLLSSCITSTIIPLYIEARDRQELRSANRFASNTLTIFSILALAASALMMVFAGPIVKLIYYGFESERMQLTVDILKIMMPALVFFAISLVMTSILNAHERFVAAQLTGFPLSLCVILGIVLFPSYGIKAVAWGVFFSGILQVVIMIPALRGRFSYSPRLDLTDARFRRMMRLAIPAVLSMTVNELNHIIDRSLASGLNTGDISAMHSAYSLITFILGVLIVPITTITFSGMSRKAAANDKTGIGTIVMDSLEMILFIGLPVIALASILSDGVIRAAFFRGAFTEEAVKNTASIFVFYVIGVIGFGMRDLLNRAFHSMQDTKTTLFTALVSVVLNVILNLILRRTMGASGLALATSISCFVGAVLLFLQLSHRLDGIKVTPGNVIEILKIICGTLMCAALCMLLNRLVPVWHGTLGAIGRLLLIGFTCAAAYVLFCLGLRVQKFSMLVRTLLKGR